MPPLKSLKLSQVKWTKKDDTVVSNNGLFNPKNFTVNTDNGDDKIIGTDFVNGDLGFGIFGKAPSLSMMASTEFSRRANIAVQGIQNQGFINTGASNDIVSGTAIANLCATATAVSQAIAFAQGDFGFGIFGKAPSLSMMASAQSSRRANIAVQGIQNQAIITTGLGNDIVSGIAIANLCATATAVFQAIAFAQKANTSVTTNTFASVEFCATADGINNFSGEINTGEDDDSIYGSAIGSVAADATAYADASAIVETICKAPMSEGLTAFAGAMAISLAKATITVTGINNSDGKITTDNGNDTIIAGATSSSSTSSVAVSKALSTLNSANSGNQAIAEALAFAEAKAKDKAIAIDNTGGWISTGDGKDTIIAKTTGSESYGIFGGRIDMGKGDDRLEASSFGGGVNIDMGKGNDFVQGFGNATIDGGKGYDILSFGSYNKSDFNIYSQNSCTMFQLKLDNTTMNTYGFEEFMFAQGSYSSRGL
jgi:hypothetical protein